MRPLSSLRPLLTGVMALLLALAGQQWLRTGLVGEGAAALAVAAVIFGGLVWHGRLLELADPTQPAAAYPERGWRRVAVGLLLAGAAVLALRTAQLVDADFLVFASLVSLGENQMTVQAYGLTQQQQITTLRVALRVLDGTLGTQLYGDTVAVSEKVLQNSHMQVQLGDLVNTLLDRGAEELAGRVKSQVARIEAAKAEAPALASVTINSSAAGAAVELDGVVIGTAPGVFQIRPGVHEIRVTREGYATWEKSIALADGQVLDVPMELSGAGIARKGELEAQDIAREQSAADAQATTTIAGGVAAQASNSYIRLEGMPGQSLTIGDTDSSRGNVNVIQQQ